MDLRTLEKAVVMICHREGVSSNLWNATNQMTLAKVAIGDRRGRRGKTFLQ